MYPLYPLPPSHLQLFIKNTYSCFIFFLCTLFTITFLTLPPHAHAQSENAVFKVRGIGGGGGFFTPIFSPYDKDFLMVVCDMGGVYRSTNGGKNWKMLHWKEQPKFAYHRPQAIFLTENKIVWLSGATALSISEDKGATWKTLPAGPWNDAKATDSKDTRRKNIRSFLPLDTKGELFLVATDFGLWKGSVGGWTQISKKMCTDIKKIGNYIYYLENNTNLIISSDNGNTWKSLPLPEKVTAFDGVITDDAKNIFYIAIENKGIFSSIDLGKTWQLRTDEHNHVEKFIIPQNQTDIAYAVQNRRAQPPSLLRTVDGGENWENTFRMHKKQETFWQELNVQQSWLQSSLYWSYYFTTHGVSVSPYDPKLLLATTQGEFFISKNGGDSWETLFSEVLPPFEGDTVPRNKSIGLEVTSIWGYHFDPHDENRQYIAYTDIGFARSLDKGQTWSWSGTGSPWTNTFYDIAFDPKIPGKMYAAASRLHDIPHFTVISHVEPSKSVYHGGVVVSTDYGKTWKVPYEKNKGLPTQVCTTVIIDPASNPEKRTLYAGIFGEKDDKSGVYISEDDGKTWRPTKSQPGDYNRHIYKLRIHPKTGVLYCLVTALRGGPHSYSADQGGIWTSSDKGNTWKHISKNSKLSHWATSIEFHPTDPQGIYVSSVSAPGVGGGGIYYTKDNGKRWWLILADKDIKRLVGISSGYDHWMSVKVHPQKTNIIFAGASIHGLFFSTNGGRTWRWCKEFPFANAQSITFDPRDPEKLFVTTFGSGVWSASLKELLQKYNISYDKL